MASLINAINTAKFNVIVKIYTELKDICATLVVDKAEENRETCFLFKSTGSDGCFSLLKIM